jgi:NAD(P)-dependent dehydrogenase (short-subunit alcohol dehydrogenase family)
MRTCGRYTPNHGDDGTAAEAIDTLRVVDLWGARLLVTGGASGIGAATVGRLRERGARVAVLDVQDPTEEAEVALRCDVADEAAVVASVASVSASFGGLDGAVLAAGIGASSPLLEMTTAEWDRVMSVNLRGVFVSLRECARAVVATGSHGAIVAVGSVSGFLADRTLAHYAASKAGLSALVRVAARELGAHGVRVNGVAPGTTDTPMFAPTDAIPGYRERVAARAALGRLGTAPDVAAAIEAMLTLDWVTGQVLVVDGGVSLASPIDPTD